MRPYALKPVMSEQLPSVSAMLSAPGAGVVAVVHAGWGGCGGRGRLRLWAAGSEVRAKPPHDAHQSKRPRHR